MSSHLDYLYTIMTILTTIRKLMNDPAFKFNENLTKVLGAQMVESAKNINQTILKQVSIIAGSFTKILNKI